MRLDLSIWGILKKSGMATTETNLRQEFFDWIFGEAEGYICIATAKPVDPRRTFSQHFFHWPTQKDDMLQFIDVGALSKNVWFCVNLLDSNVRKKETCLPLDIVWADLDTCKPEEVVPYPSLVLKSSTDRYQAIWKVDQTLPPDVAEDYSKRIAYKYSTQGADPSGWDLTQLLRVPFTKNYKYELRPTVLPMPDIKTEPYDLSLFEQMEIPPLTPAELELSEGMPEDIPDADKIVYKYQSYIDRGFLELYTAEPQPDEDWSARMWKLLNLAFEAGMDSAEVFAIGFNAACNKYRRDNRPMRYLWREVVKARDIQRKITAVTGSWEPLLIPELVQPEEYEEDTFIDQYFEWASQATDAIEIYHELSAAMLMSSALAGHLRLDVSYGSMIPNLWGLVLGDSTLSRKTTAMSMAMSILREVDDEAVLATDGSAEGLLSGLSTRPGRVSVFYKDEVSGFFDSINRKDYLAGMPETLTQLYDVPEVYHRVLRKETITITKPVFIFFGGGIREQVYSLLSDQYILSGFLPRFLIVSGNADLSKIRPTGPPNMEGVDKRQKIVNTLMDAKELYNIENEGFMRIGSQSIPLKSLTDVPQTQAVMTPQAWELYGRYELTMLEAATHSYYAMLALPTFERLSRSLLKLATLLAAVRQEPRDGAIDVEVRDVIQAARFVQKWGQFSVDLIMNAGKSDMMRQLEKIRRTIEGKPGIAKSELLRATHMSSRHMNDIISTLLDRGEIQRKTKGRGENFWLT